MKVIKRIPNCEVDVIASPRKISVRFGEGVSDFQIVPLYKGCKTGDKGDLCYVEYSKSMCVWEFQPY